HVSAGPSSLGLRSAQGVASLHGAQLGGGWRAVLAASTASVLSQSLRDATSLKTGCWQPLLPRDTTPMICPSASSAGPPESPGQGPPEPIHSLSRTPVSRQLPPVHTAFKPSSRLRTPEG